MNKTGLLRRISFYLSYWGSRTPPWDTGVSPPELLELLRTSPPGRAIDMGCGTGTNAITMARYGWQVVGIDFVPKAIRKARSKARQAGAVVDFVYGDVTRLDGIEGSFDLVLDIGCFHGLTDEGRSRYLVNLEKIMKPGSLLLLYVFFRDDETSTKPGVVERDLQEIGQRLNLISRRDGSERGLRLSAWLEFRKE
jgi:SAM-dependent methyltransferase